MTGTSEQDSADVSESLWLRAPAQRAPAQEDGAVRFTLPLDSERLEGQLKTWVAQVSDPALLRNALGTLIDVLYSDSRFKAQDRSDYLAYLARQGKSASKELWEAQKAFLKRKYDEEAESEVATIDLIVTSSGEQLTLEAFSADESAYARLTLGQENLDQAAANKSFTSYVPVSAALRDASRQLRSYRSCNLVLSSEGADECERRKVDVAYRWLRSFGQVQCAATLPGSELELTPIDVYNVLRSLRLSRAKTSPRALRYELVPGEVPRVVLEPWNVALPARGAVYDGKTPQVVRTWGRGRLQLLARLLPQASKIRVFLKGSGLPAFYVMDLPGAQLTLALSGWSASGWGAMAAFDQLSAAEPKEEDATRVLEAMQTPQTSKALAKATGLKPSNLREVLLAELLRGRAYYDLATAQYHARDLLPGLIPLEKLRFQSARERQAHRLLEEKGQVKLDQVHDLGPEGVRIEGSVTDRQAHRTYATSFTLDREGRTVDASCTSREFKRSGLKEGPTTPMIALRLLYARQSAELEAGRKTEAGRRRITAETRVLTRRYGSDTLTYRVSLQDKRVRVRWAKSQRPGESERLQQLWFTSSESAREAYFARLDELAEHGFIDASEADRV